MKINYINYFALCFLPVTKFFDNSLRNALILFVLVLSSNGCSQTPSYDLAIKDVKLFNSKTKVVFENQTILINSDTIASIVNNNFKYKADKIIEGNNRLLTPGFVDTHIHLTQIFGDGNEIAPEYINNPSVYQEVLAEQYLNYGTTTIADMGQPEKWMETTIKWQNNPQPNYPNILVGGGALKSDYDYDVNMNHAEVLNEENARTKIKNYKKLGANHVKLYAFLNSEDMRVILKEAKKQDLPVFGHVDRNDISLSTALNLGLKNFEHFFTLGESVFINENWQVFRDNYKLNRTATTDEFAATMTFLMDYISKKPENLKSLNLLIDELAINDATISTTIHVLGSVAGETNAFSSFTTFPLRSNPDLPNYTDEQKQKLKGAFKTLMRILKKVHDKGVRLRIGTDCRYGGEAMISELILLSKAGFSIGDVLQIATQNGAEALKIDDRLGAVERGKKADLILFDKNPFDDYNNFLSNKTIVKGGKIHATKKPLSVRMFNIINDESMEAAIVWFSDFRHEFREDELNAVGYRLLLNGNIKYAITIFNFALGTTPNSKNAYNALNQEQMNSVGHSLLEKNRIEDAIKIFEFNIAQFPKSESAYHGLGQAYLENGNKMKAILNYEKSIEINPNNESSRDALKKLKIE